jgi:rRNA maturation endonuclease Nob1
MTDSKEQSSNKKYVAICFKCREYELTVPTRESVCPVCGGELKIVGERTNIMTSNGSYKRHL